MGHLQLHCGRYRLSLAQPLIMGIVNITPDSFSDGGRFISKDQAVEHGIRLIEEGADLLDLGGESTRPGAPFVPAQAEMERVLPVVEALRDRGVPLSVDTRKVEVMVEAIRAGASMINDVQGLEGSGALAAVAASDVAVCLMHMQGEPGTMQKNPQYADVVEDVYAYLARRVAAAQGAGIAPDRIVVDPGFGFGKNLAHNIELMRRLPRFHGLGTATLVGLSRKSMLGQITGREVGERVYASVAAAVLAMIRGAKIVRVHDVAATRDALRVVQAIEESHD